MQINSVSVWGDSIGKCIVFDEARGRYAICKDNYAAHLKAGGVTVENHSVMGYTVCQAQLAEKDMRPGGVAAIEFGGNDCDLDWKAVSENPDIYHEARTPIALFKDKLAEMVKKARAFDMRAVLVVPAAHRRGEVLRLGVEKPQSQGDPQVSGRRAAHLPLAGALRAGGGGNRQQIELHHPQPARRLSGGAGFQEPFVPGRHPPHAGGPQAHLGRGQPPDGGGAGMKYRCIAFDIDGTLLDSAPADAAGLQVALRRELGREEPLDALLATFGMPGREILAALGVPEADAERVLRTWQAEKRARAGWMRIFPGVEKALDGLRARGASLGIVTSKRPESYARTLRPLHWTAISTSALPAPTPFCTSRTRNRC